MMVRKPNDIEKFWHELKRRKVIHVITVYAAVSFVILQLVDIIEQPLRLPEWTTALVIVLLCIGFVISVFVSWVYDITPAGLRKTKPVSTIKHSDHSATPTSSGWKIATYVSAVIILVLVAINILSYRKQTGSQKSIAVLPFTLLSDEPDKQYLADGIMNAIHLHLSKIKDLRVMPTVSVEQYRETKKVAHIIGKELDVEYLLDGNVQKYGADIKLIVRLIKAKDESNVWIEEYNRNWKDIFSVESEIAQTVAKELYTKITQEEKRLIEKVPTSDTAAYELYLRANDYLKEYEKIHDSSFYKNAVTFYKTALGNDPSFAKAYTGLANAYYSRYQWETYFKENYLDSMRILADQALLIDSQLDEAYYLKGLYYQKNGQPKEALYNFDQALKSNPNYYAVYEGKGYILIMMTGDCVKGIENLYSALNFTSVNERSALLYDLGIAYQNVGFFDKTKYYYDEKLKLDGDSASYLQNLAYMEFSIGNIENANLLNEKASRIDTAFIPNNDWYSIAGEHQKAYLATKREIQRLKKSGTIPLLWSHRIGYAFWMVGKHKEAENYFKEQIKIDTESINRGREIAGWGSAQYDLASVYAFLGDREKAYQYLNAFNTLNFYPTWFITYAKYDPLFNSIRTEERFQKILQNMEAKYKAEHERVKKWLEENNML